MTGHAEFLRQLRAIAGRSRHRQDLPAPATRSLASSLDRNGDHAGATSPRLTITPATRPIIGDTDLSEGGK